MLTGAGEKTVNRGQSHDWRRRRWGKPGHDGECTLRVTAGHRAGHPSRHRAATAARNRQGTVNRYTRAAVPLYSAVFSAAVAPAVMRLNAFHNSV